MLRLGTDVEFDHLDREHVTFTFTITNQKAVHHFLTNKRLITFLTDPYVGRMEDNGCRMTIKQDGTKLIIGRQLSRTTLLPAALKDALITIGTYIIPTAKEDDFGAWADMVGGVMDSTLQPDNVPKKSLPRGIEFVGIEAPDLQLQTPRAS